MQLNIITTLVSYACPPALLLIVNWSAFLESKVCKNYFKLFQVTLTYIEAKTDNPCSELIQN